jgi:hypothetical protein
MGALCFVTTAVNLLLILTAVYLFSAPNAMLKAAAWLIAKHKAAQERRAAFLGIEQERRAYEDQLREKLLKGIEIDGTYDESEPEHAGYTGI